MRVLPLLLCACAAAPAKPAPADPPPRNYALYKFLQRIGYEHSVFRGREIRTTFTFNDRGTDVTLAAEYSVGPSGAPVRFEAWGSNARGVPYEVKAQGEQGLAKGYAPVIGQELLLRTWRAQGSPPRLALQPGGEVEITPRGTDTFTLSGKELKLQHVALRGLGWGREDVWLGEGDQLVGLVTRDAEFDHFAAVRIGETPLAPQFVARAGADAVAWLAETVPPQSAPVTALIHARLIDGTGAPPVDDATVVLEGDRIAAAGAGVKAPAGARVVDLTGKTVIPGLWDMHAHVEQVEQLAAYLAAGVTSVRDVGNIPPFIQAIHDAIESGKGVGPRVVIDPLIDGEGRQSLGILRISEPEQIAPTLDKLKAEGAREIKIYSSFKPKLVAPLCKAAHERGLRVTGHVPTGMDAVEAIEAGFDGINHLHYATDELLPRTPEERSKLTRDELKRLVAHGDLATPRLQKLLALSAEKHVLWDPTLALFELESFPLPELQKREPGLLKMPPELRDNYQGEDDELSRARFQTDLAVLRELHRRGVPIVAGTDIGVPGHSLHRELELYVEAGFTPLQALQSATLVPARALGFDGELGTIAAGKRADLVVLGADPLQDIHAVRDVRLVFARGRAFEPAPLWTLAGFTP